jgi:hypothetical protein
MKGAAMWWTDENNNQINSAHVISLSEDQTSPGVWKLKADFGGGITVYVKGTWGTQADVEAAAQKLVQGFDPSTL